LCSKKNQPIHENSKRHKWNKKISSHDLKSFHKISSQTRIVAILFPSDYNIYLNFFCSSRFFCYEYMFSYQAFLVPLFSERLWFVTTMKYIYDCKKNFHIFCCCQYSLMSVDNFFQSFLLVELYSSMWHCV